MSTVNQDLLAALTELHDIVQGVLDDNIRIPGLDSCALQPARATQGVDAIAIAEAKQRQRMQERFANRNPSPATADFDLPAPNDNIDAEQRQPNAETPAETSATASVARTCKYLSPEKVRELWRLATASHWRDRDDSIVQEFARLLTEELQKGDV